MYKNQLFVLLVTLSIFQLVSCKKDAGNTSNTTTTTTNNIRPVDAIAGNFYCKKEARYGYGSSAQLLYINDTANLVVSLDVENSFIYFGDGQNFNHYFSITSSDQTHFEKDTLSTTLNLDFYNNYDSLVFYYDAFYAGGGSRSEIYTGSKTNLLASTPTHAYNSDLEGNYTLNIHKRNTSTGLDTQYTSTLFVSHADYKLMVGGDYLYSDLFHNRIKYHTYQDYTTHYNKEYSIYWENDSLFVEFDSITYPQLDTVYYRFSGAK